MSIPSGNVATVRRALGAYASGDLPSFFSELDRDVEWIGAREFPDARAFFTSPMAMLIDVRRGKLAFVQLFLDLDEARAAAGLA